MKKIKVFVASPGDVPEERQIVNLVVNELNASIGDLLDVHLDTIKWETHAWPDVGEDAQDVINKEISEFDVFVGMMWKRYGTPTKRADSGTGEEFEKAYSLYKMFNRPKIMFYFKKTKFYTTRLEDISQFRSVIEFRTRLAEFGVLFWEYDDTLEFERNLRVHLTNQIKNIVKQPLKVSKKSKVFLSYRRVDLNRVEPIYDIIKSNGFEPWMDVKDILPGKIWVDEIEKNIGSCDVFISIISKNSTTKTESITGFSTPNELNFAIEKFSEPAASESLDLPKDTHIIPLRIDNVVPPEELNNYQWLDYFEDGGIQLLIKTLEKLKEEKKSS